MKRLRCSSSRMSRILIHSAGISDTLGRWTQPTSHDHFSGLSQCGSGGMVPQQRLQPLEERPAVPLIGRVAAACGNDYAGCDQASTGAQTTADSSAGCPTAAPHCPQPLVSNPAQKQDIQRRFTADTSFSRSGSPLSVAPTEYMDCSSEIFKMDGCNSDVDSEHWFEADRDNDEDLSRTADGSSTSSQNGFESFNWHTRYRHEHIRRKVSMEQSCSTSRSISRAYIKLPSKGSLG